MLMLSCAAISLSLGTSAAAQTVPEQEAAQTSNEAGRETSSAAPGTGQGVVVTAQKRAPALIDVPQSISVVSHATLEQQHSLTAGY
jgi:outer membrane receptor protein involved in Fe transport